MLWTLATQKDISKDLKDQFEEKSKKLKSLTAMRDSLKEKLEKVKHTNDTR